MTLKITSQTPVVDNQTPVSQPASNSLTVQGAPSATVDDNVDVNYGGSSGAGGNYSGSADIGVPSAMSSMDPIEIQQAMANNELQMGTIQLNRIDVARDRDLEIQRYVSEARAAGFAITDEVIARASQMPSVLAFDDRLHVLDDELLRYQTINASLASRLEIVGGMIETANTLETSTLDYQLDRVEQTRLTLTQDTSMDPETKQSYLDQLDLIEENLNKPEATPSDVVFWGEELGRLIMTVESGVQEGVDASAKIQEIATALGLDVEKVDEALGTILEENDGELPVPPTADLMEALAILDPEINKLVEDIGIQTGYLENAWTTAQDKISKQNERAGTDGWGTGLKGAIETSAKILKGEHPIQRTIINLKKDLAGRIAEMLNSLYGDVQVATKQAARVDSDGEGDNDFEVFPGGEEDWLTSDWLASDKIMFQGRLYDIFNNDSQKLSFRRALMPNPTTLNNTYTNVDDIMEELDNEGEVYQRIMGGDDENWGNSTTDHQAVPEVAGSYLVEDDELSALRDPVAVAINWNNDNATEAGIFESAIDNGYPTDNGMA